MPSTPAFALRGVGPLAATLAVALVLCVAATLAATQSAPTHAWAALRPSTVPRAALPLAGPRAGVPAALGHGVRAVHPATVVAAVSDRVPLTPSAAPAASPAPLGLAGTAAAAVAAFAAAWLAADLLRRVSGRAAGPARWVALAAAGAEAAAAEDPQATYAAALAKAIGLVRKSIAEHRVILFMKGVPKNPQCGYSAGVVDILKAYPDVKWVACNVLQDAMVREAVKQVGDWPTLPQLYVDGDLIGGFDILSDLHGKGELGAILKGPSA
eukprot:EG_transcript_19863